ncbi:MAG: hypothetical protein LKF42_09530 [Streptococcaceae bacterium]|jgi:hypothetical protein|nr:hypothetical protein [Streptococcaceae bacterium]MCH4178103.1 hypothetical protein [Streptococcaceae bacterium]
MEKTINIDGQKVRLKSTAGTPKRYKAQFRKDYFSELLKLSKLMTNVDGDTFDLSKIDYSELDYLDFEVFYNFIWVLAKTANKEIGDPQEWLDEFDAMPIAEVFPEIIDLLESSITSKKKLTK